MAATSDAQTQLIVFGLLGFFVATQLLLGGVVIEQQFNETGYWLKFRDAELYWQKVPLWRYCLYTFSNSLHLVVVALGLVFAVIHWLKKDIRNE